MEIKYKVENTRKKSFHLYGLNYIQKSCIEKYLSTNLDMFMDYANCLTKSCHCANKYWLFGVYMQHDIALSEEELKFGHDYREIYANFIKTGEIGLKSWNELNDKEFNVFGYGEPSTETVFEKQCEKFEEINVWMEV